MTTEACIHACIEKPSYPTRGEANRAGYRAILYKNRIKIGVGPYECPFGRHWHIGTSKFIKEAA